ncbi:uncharacterized protein LOC126844389 isoform X2 [Adelges cooleyi]|uniref:uncharacterized protein LOC126844389 isoform X2 n=1 Tax=Adelges cooleyi TaxID=133065 RepID=UPI00217F8093|nr:uncharacterized protein LOC126844389 isoform X2 [Adelges cooleyi]
MYDTSEENTHNADLKLPSKERRSIRILLAKKEPTKEKNNATPKKLVSVKRGRTVQKPKIKKAKPKSAKIDEIKQEHNLKSKRKCTEHLMSGDFVVLKTDMTHDGYPLLWKVSGRVMLQKYLPFEQDGKTLYKNTCLVWTYIFLLEFQHKGAILFCSGIMLKANE